MAETERERKKGRKGEGGMEGRKERKERKQRQDRKESDKERKEKKEAKRKKERENSKGKMNSHLASSLGCKENVTLFSKLLPWSVYLRQTSPVASAGYK